MREEQFPEFIKWYERNVYLSQGRDFVYMYDIDTVTLYFGTLQEVYEYYLALNK